MARDPFNNEHSEDVPLDDLLGSLPSFEQQFDPDPSPTSLPSGPAFDDDGPPAISVAGPSSSSDPKSKSAPAKRVTLEEAEAELDIAGKFASWRLKRRMRRNEAKRQELGQPIDRHDDDPFAQLLQPLSKSELRKESIPPKRIFLHRKERWRRQEDLARRGGIMLGLLLFAYILWMNGKDYLNGLVELQAPQWFDRLPPVADEYHLQILIVLAVFAPLAILAATSIGIAGVLRGIIRRKPLLSLEGIPALLAAWVAFQRLRDGDPAAALIVAVAFLLVAPLLRLLAVRLLDREERV